MIKNQFVQQHDIGWSEFHNQFKVQRSPTIANLSLHELESFMLGSFNPAGTVDSTSCYMLHKSNENISYFTKKKFNLTSILQNHG